MSKGYKAFCYFFALAAFAGAGFLFYHAGTSHQNHRWLSIGIGILVIALGCYVIWEVRATLVTVDDYSVMMQSAFLTRSILLKDLEGYRVGEKDHFFLVPRTGKQRQLTQGIERRGELIEWIKENYTDLDARDLEANAEELLGDERFGLTKEDREETLAKTKRFTRAANIVGVAVALWYYFYPVPYELAMAGAFLAPLVALYMCWRSNGLIKFYSTKTSPYPSLGTLIAGPIFAIGLKALLAYDIYAFPAKAWALMVGGIVALLLLVLVFAREAFASEKKKGGFIFVALVAAATYSYGTLIISNGHFDQGRGQEWPVKVTDKYETHGKSTSYYVKVSPWAEYDTSSAVKISSRFYDLVNTGDSIRVVLKPGKWGIPWYFLVAD